MSLSAHVSEFTLRDIIITGERDSWVAQMTPEQAREFAAELIERADYADTLRAQGAALEDYPFLSAAEIERRDFGNLAQSDEHPSDCGYCAAGEPMIHNYEPAQGSEAMPRE